MATFTKPSRRISTARDQSRKSDDQPDRFKASEDMRSVLALAGLLFSILTGALVMGIVILIFIAAAF